VAEPSDAGEHLAMVAPDPQLRLPGRGAWLHPTPECLELAVRRKAFGRALRAEAFLDAAGVGAYIDSHKQSADNAVGSNLEQAVEQFPETESGFDADERPMSNR
jgi:predicted RNA-binding protein YlxR (DUF448 family)